MIAILSPAMNMVAPERENAATTIPVFDDKAHELANKLHEYSSWELESLLGINPQLALKSSEYYQDFGRGNMPAVLAFHGLAYQNLSPQDFTAQDMEFASGHLRILSSLYGLLRPLDGISHYRLDFMCRFAKRENLYKYWGDTVCRKLFSQGDTVINLCSAEYEKLVIPHLKPNDKLISCRFLVSKRGTLRCQATASKMARGQMARFIIKNRIESPEHLKAFDWDGYEFVERLSTRDTMTFVNQ